MNKKDFSVFYTKHIDLIESTMRAIPDESMYKVYTLLADALNKGKQIFTMGNGASGSLASHMMCDFNKEVSLKKKKRFKVISLSDNVPIMTAYANDISYDMVFQGQLENLMNKGDLVLGISGSGNSTNVIKAIDWANTHGGVTIGWCGFDGGKLKQKAKHVIHANIKDMQIAENAHFILLHLFTQILRDN